MRPGIPHHLARHSSEATALSRAKNWCFTLNNYTEESVQRMKLPNPHIRYLIAGREIAETGTPHLQGFVSFKARKRLSQVVTLIGQCHLSVTRCVAASIEYCKKDDDYFEVGVAIETRGNNNADRASLEEFKNAVKEGLTDMREVREQFSDVYSKHFRFVSEYIADQRTGFVFDFHPLRDWQIEMYAVLRREPDSRMIYFVVDETGNSGKTWFAHYFCHMQEDAQVLCPGKKADMAFALCDVPRAVFIDCPRSKQGEFLQYDFIEEVKNGYVWCSKYESRFKVFKTPHVVVMLNEHPDMSKLSTDRYKIIVV